MKTYMEGIGCVMSALGNFAATAGNCYLASSKNWMEPPPTGSTTGKREARFQVILKEEFGITW